MIIKSIHLNNFRNYRRLDLEVGPSVNIVYGFNAQGKTNIIEAINVCSCLSSHRTSKEKDLITINEDEYEVSLDLSDTKDNFETSLFVGYYTDKSSKTNYSSNKRILKQDNMVVPKIAQYLGICNTVIFAPEDLNIVKGAPSIRRRFFNLIISKTSPSYFDLLTRFNKVFDQKNAVLKSLRGGRPDDMALDYWDYPLADISAEIILYRYRYSIMLDSYAAKHHAVISDEAEKLKVEYNTVSGSIELIKGFLNENGLFDDYIAGKLSTAIYGQIKAIVSNHLYTKFKATRQNDCERGNMSCGIQKDDLDISLNDLPMKSFTSQGQQRSASLSLKLAELEIVRAGRSSPVLLLDDVFSELDVKRRVSLLSGMVDAQIFITCTERDYIEKELKALLKTNEMPRFFRVEAGNVYPE